MKNTTSSALQGMISHSLVTDAYTNLTVNAFKRIVGNVRICIQKGKFIFKLCPGTVIL